MSDGNYLWYWANEPEAEHWSGPKDSRDAAIAAGREYYDGDTFAICEADKAVYDFTDLFDGDDDEDLAELRIDDSYIEKVLIRWSETDEGVGEDGPDWDFGVEDRAALVEALLTAQATPSTDPDGSCPRAEAMSKAFQDWAEARRPSFGDPYMFGNVRISETLLAAPLSVTVAVLEKLSDHPEEFTWMVGAFQQGLAGGNWPERPAPSGDELCAVARNTRGTIVGAATFFAVDHGKHWVDLVFVMPEVRRRGVGRSILQAIKTRCDQDETKGIMFGTMLGNEAMQGLGAALGFGSEYLVCSTTAGTWL